MNSRWWTPASAPILWRLRRYEIELPPQAQALARYASMLFARPAFRASLSDAEIEMRAIDVVARHESERGGVSQTALSAARDA